MLLRRSVSFHVVPVGCRVCWSALVFRWFLGRPHSPGTVVALLFHIVVLGQRRDQGWTAGQLADAVQDDLGASVVEFDRSVDFDGSAGEAADIAHVFEIGRKDNDREGAGHLVFAEIEKVHAASADFYSLDFPGDTFDFADVLAGVLDGKAVRAGEELERR